eukprot:TRINITY_DN6326_c0_g2_i1.p1 TRINITY_DN6326_c0_g2~~TRINITY_DN6326_c0_g2_i1.p1  ORF type:complete len:1781 (+),score=346.10 TRINITY_DN6326_c0_g2_i1:770-5344(+)
MYQRKKLIHSNLWQPTDEFKVPILDAAEFKAEEEEDRKEAIEERARLNAAHQELAVPQYTLMPPAEENTWNPEITAKFNSDYQRGLLHMEEPPAELLIGARPSSNPHGLSTTGRQGKSHTSSSSASRQDSASANRRRTPQARPKPAEAHAAVEAAGSVGFLASVDRSKLHKLPEVVKFFHPTRWTAQEVALVREMLQVYGKDWTLVAGLLGKSKTAQVLKNTYKMSNGNWDIIPTISVLETTCSTCGGSFSQRPMVFCSCCDKGYHISCTDPPLARIPTDGDWFCSHECAASSLNRCEGCGGDRSTVLGANQPKSSSSSSAATPNSSAATADAGDALMNSAMDVDPSVGAGGEVVTPSTSSSEEQLREMVQCDQCGKSWHAGCLSPKLESVPEGDWICPRCTSRSQTNSSDNHDMVQPQSRLPKCEHAHGVSPMLVSTSAADAYRTKPITSGFVMSYTPLADPQLKAIVASLQTLPWNYLLALGRVCLDCHFAKFAGGYMVPRDITMIPTFMTALDLEVQNANPGVPLPDFFRGSIFKYSRREDITVTVPNLNNELMQVHFGRLLNTVENAIIKMIVSPVFRLDKSIEQQLERVHKKQLRETLQAAALPLESVGRRAASSAGSSGNGTPMTTRIPHTGLRATDSRRSRKRARSLGGETTSIIMVPDGNGNMVPAPAPRSTSSSQTSYEDFNREDGYSENDYRYWIFQANPQLYDINSSIKMLPDMTWFVKQHINRIRKGDRVFIWESGKNAGVIGTGTVKSDPVQIVEVPGMLQFTYVKQLFDTVQLRCHLHVDCVLPAKVFKPEFQGHPILCQLTILRAPIGTNFRITKTQGLSLEQLVRDRMAIGGGTVHPDPTRLPTQVDVSQYINHPGTIVTQPTDAPVPLASTTHHGTARTRAAAAAAQQRASTPSDSSSPPAPKRRRVNPPVAAVEHFEEPVVHTSARTQEYGKQKNSLDTMVRYKDDHSPYLIHEVPTAAPKKSSAASSRGSKNAKREQPQHHTDVFELEDVDDSGDEASPKPKRQKLPVEKKSSKPSHFASQTSDIPNAAPAPAVAPHMPPVPELNFAVPSSSPVKHHPAASPSSLLASSPSGHSMSLAGLGGLGAPPPFSLDSHTDLSGVDSVPDFETHDHHLTAHMDDDTLGMDPSLDLIMHTRDHDDIVDAMLNPGGDDLMDLDEHSLLTDEMKLQHMHDFSDHGQHSDGHLSSPDSKPPRAKRKRADHFLGPMAPESISPRAHNTRGKPANSTSPVSRSEVNHAEGDMMQVDTHGESDVLLVQPLVPTDPQHVVRPIPEPVRHLNSNEISPAEFDQLERHEMHEELLADGSTHDASDVFHDSSYADQTHLHHIDESAYQTPASSTTTTAIGSPAPAPGAFQDQANTNVLLPQPVHEEPTHLGPQACASCGEESTASSAPFCVIGRNSLCSNCTMTFGMLENLILAAGLRELWTELERLIQIKTDYAIRQHRKNIAEVSDPAEMFRKFDQIVKELRDGKQVMILAASTSFNNFRERVQKNIKRDMNPHHHYQH